MNAKQIRKWRPTKFADLIGSKNQAVVRRMQESVIRKAIPSPLLFVSRFGDGKTSFVRLMMLAINCMIRGVNSADPCLNCDQCRCSGPLYCGHGHPFRRFEYDCTILTKSNLAQLLVELFFEDGSAVFFDELHRLDSKSSQEPMLKFLEDFPGLCFAAVMEDRLDQLIPPLRERFDVVQLYPPTNVELVAFLEVKARDWDLDAPLPMLEMMVDLSRGSFRACLKTLASAAERDRILNTDVLRMAFGDEVDTFVPGDQQGPKNQLITPGHGDSTFFV